MTAVNFPSGHAFNSNPLASLGAGVPLRYCATAMTRSSVRMSNKARDHDEMGRLTDGKGLPIVRSEDSSFEKV